MSFCVVTSPCVGVKDKACVKICPVDCFYDAGDMLVIDPEECIDCGLCIAECPVKAIYSVGDVPAGEQKFIAVNADFFKGKSREELDRSRVSD
jgi:NAD-dependent dihydropyrimidine dehydrogenase PreA subunit